MKIDTGFGPSRVIEHFRNLRGEIDGAAGTELRKDLHRIKGAIQDGKEPAKVKDAIRDVHSDVEDAVELRQIKDEIKQIRADFRSGVSPEQLQGDLQALKDKLNTFVEDGSIDGHAVVGKLRHALSATIQRLRHHDDVPTPMPSPVDPGPVVADGADTVTPAPGSVDFSA